MKHLTQFTSNLSEKVGEFKIVKAELEDMCGVFKVESENGFAFFISIEWLHISGIPDAPFYEWTLTGCLSPMNYIHHSSMGEYHYQHCGGYWDILKPEDFESLEFEPEKVPAHVKWIAAFANELDEIIGSATSDDLDDFLSNFFEGWEELKRDLNNSAGTKPAGETIIGKIKYPPGPFFAKIQLRVEEDLSAEEIVDQTDLEKERGYVDRDEAVEWLRWFIGGDQEE